MPSQEVYGENSKTSQREIPQQTEEEEKEKKKQEFDAFSNEQSRLEELRMCELDEFDIAEKSN